MALENGRVYAPARRARGAPCEKSPSVPVNGFLEDTAAPGPWRRSRAAKTWKSVRRGEVRLVLGGWGGSRSGHRRRQQILPLFGDQVATAAGHRDRHRVAGVDPAMLERDGVPGHRGDGPAAPDHLGVGPPPAPRDPHRVAGVDPAMLERDGFPGHRVDGPAAPDHLGVDPPLDRARGPADDLGSYAGGDHLGRVGVAVEERHQPAYRLDL